MHVLDTLTDDVILYLMNFVDHKDLFNTIPYINYRFNRLLNPAQDWWYYFYNHRFNIAQDTVPTYGEFAPSSKLWKDLCIMRYLENERWVKGTYTNSQILSHGYGTISCIKLVNHVYENEQTEYILSGSSDRQIRIWKNLVSLDSDCNWTCQQVLRGHFDTITCIEVT
jgi:WD40 repeat protein